MQSKPEARIARPGERERWRGGGAKRRGVAVAWGSAFGRVDELAHGVLGPPSVVPVGLGEGVEAPLEANDGDGEVREAGEIARQVAGSHPATVFVVGDVAHVVESIFESPIGLLLLQSKFSAFQISIQHTETIQKFGNGPNCGKSAMAS